MCIPVLLKNIDDFSANKKKFIESAKCAGTVNHVYK
jgi:hypothetical protein